MATRGSGLPDAVACRSTGGVYDMLWWRSSIEVVCCAAVLGLAVAPVAAKDLERERDDDEGVYLALGDSVAFGTNPLLDSKKAKNFVGYREALAKQLDLKLTNAWCPGESSGG